MNRLASLPVAIATALVAVTAAPGVARAATTEPALPVLEHAKVRAGAPLLRDAQGRVLYTVMLRDPPVALYHGPDVVPVAGLPKLSSERNADGKLDLKSPEAKAYAAHLASGQDALLKRARAAGLQLQVSHTFQYALNGFSAWMSEAGAARLARLPGVVRVAPVPMVRLMGRSGVEMIHAPDVWWGQPGMRTDTLFVQGFEPPPPGNRGEGVVVGVMDTGVNFPSHAFDVTDESGFTITNPLGSGNYLGWCNPGYAAGDGQVGSDPCSDKIIGSYDFMHGLPGEYVGSMDEHGHGSHVASTAVGNTRVVTYQGQRMTNSGVAPHANLVIYDICLEDRSCYPVPDVLEQAVTDGVVDVLNFSFGTSKANDPWPVDPMAYAKLSLTASGIFVAAAAGNGGPSPGSFSNIAPWVTTVAATTTDSSGFQWQLLVNGAAVGQIWPGSAGSPLTSALPPGTQLRLSPDFASGADGCAAYPANTFAGDFAVLRRSDSCSDLDQATHAVGAGAVAVLVANNQPYGFLPAGAPAVAVPVFGAKAAVGDSLATMLAGGPEAGGYTFPPLEVSTPADKVAWFSSRGPIQANVMKPDVAAPGVGILAAIGGGPNGDPDALGIMQGTSMATPHVAGSAALIKNAHPGWTPMEIKSALMLTAKPAAQLFLDDGVTPANSLDAGAGRIDVAAAIHSGLVMRETALDMWAADPGDSVGPTTMNLANIYDNECSPSCHFTREVTGTLPGSQQWSVTTTMDAPVTVALSDTSLVVLDGATTSFDVTVDTSAVTVAGTYFGQLTLTATGNPDTPVLHMPMTVMVPSSAINVAPGSLAFSLAAGDTARQAVVIRNAHAGVALHWHASDAPAALLPVARQPGNAADGYASFQAAPRQGSTFLSDDFVLTANHRIARLQADGFAYPWSLFAGRLAELATSVTFSVYADAAGAPAGSPDGSGAAALYSCTLESAGSPANGLSFGGLVGDGPILDLTQAAAQGCPAAPALAAGRYWLTVFPRFEHPAKVIGWARYQSDAGRGLPARVVAPTRRVARQRLARSVFADADATAFAMAVDVGVPCGAYWLGLSATMGVVPRTGSQEVSIEVDASGMSPGTYTAYVCLASNDPGTPIKVLPVTLRVR